MTQADMERRLHAIEQKLGELERNQAVLATGVALARWFTPTAISVGVLVVALVKGG